MISDKVASSLLKLLNNNSKVLDIGGARYPWWRADYILDKRLYSEKVGETAWAGSIEQKERFSEKTWIVHDFYDLPWPFPDKYFDFSLCMGTLEDLRDPISIAKEIQRVSKAGYISTPTRAWESSYIKNTHSAVRELIGYIHHRWLVQIENDELVFKFKSPLPYQYKKYIIQEPVQQTLHFLWNDSFSVKEEYYGSTETYLNDYEEFANNYLGSLTIEKAHDDIYIAKTLLEKIDKNDFMEINPTKKNSNSLKPNKRILYKIINKLFRK